MAFRSLTGIPRSKFGINTPATMTKAAPRYSPTKLMPAMSNPMQRATGRIGGNMTTAAGIQPFSAMVGNVVSPKGSKSPWDAFQSWLNPTLTAAAKKSNKGMYSNMLNDFFQRLLRG